MRDHADPVRMSRAEYGKWVGFKDAPASLNCAAKLTEELSDLNGRLERDLESLQDAQAVEGLVEALPRLGLQGLRKLAELLNITQW